MTLPIKATNPTLLEPRPYSLRYFLVVQISQQLINANYSVAPNKDGVDPVTAAFYRWRQSEYGFKDTYEALQKKHPESNTKIFSTLRSRIIKDIHHKVSTLLNNHSPLIQLKRHKPT